MNIPADLLGVEVGSYALSPNSGGEFQVLWDSTGMQPGFYTLDITAMDDSGFSNTVTIEEILGFELLFNPRIFSDRFMQ